MRAAWLLPLLMLACTGPEPDPVETDTGWIDTDTDPVETDTDTDPVDTDIDTDTDTDSDTDTDTDTDTDSDTVPCEPVEPHPQSFVGGVLRGPGEIGPGVSHVQSVDLFGTGPELLVSDAWQGRLTWYGRCNAEGVCETREIEGPFVAPTRTAVADLDADGLQDIIVADIGEIFPTTDPVGTVRVLYGQSDGSFEATELIPSLGRVVCATPADLDNDRDLDLIICEFGAEEGRLLWLEQDFAGWIEHELWETDGTIDGWAVDLDLDGDLEIVASVAQLEEVIVRFERQSDGSWLRQTDIFQAPMDWFGTSGLTMADMDRDGDLDAVVTNGDSLDGDFDTTVDPYTHYGIRWIENRRTRWVDHDILRHWGAYTSRAADFDGDCDMDLAVISFQLPETVLPQDGGEAPPSDPMFWLERKDDGSFVKHSLEGLPLPAGFTLAVLDLDSDGILDIVAAPFDISQVDLEREHLVWWRGRWD